VVVSTAEEYQKRDEAKVVSTGNEAPSAKFLVHERVKEKAESSATISLEVKTKSEETPKKDVVKLNEVHLNIRMSNGTNLQIKLVKSDALRSVKKFVDEQQDTQANSYNLAVPYPRKLFNEEGLCHLP
jgi:UBX domain